MKKSYIAIAVIIAVILIPVIILISSYNNLVQLDETVNSQWAQVENQLKRRADLIPNLVNTVKGFAEQEQEVLIGVTEARSKIESAATPQQLAEANEELTSALSRLNVVVERYPELKSDQNFIRLQDELAGTENRIAVARRDYNEAARIYNNKVRRFPTNIVAGIFGFEKREYFEIDEADKDVPEVNFD